jgi:hypothetical protein
MNGNFDKSDGQIRVFTIIVAEIFSKGSWKSCVFETALIFYIREMAPGSELKGHCTF